MKKLVFYSFFIFVVNFILFFQLIVSFDFFVYLLFDYSCFGFALEFSTGHFGYFILLLFDIILDFVMLCHLLKCFVSCLKLKLKTK